MGTLQATVRSKGCSSRQTWLGNNYRRRFVNRGHESFHGGGYSNFGFWTSSTLVGTHGDALVDRLLDLAPSASGSVLDVACGQGGTTHRLASHFSPSKVTAVNLFHDQLRAARDRAPGCRFAQMDAARLAFVDECFDVVICVEAAFHFETREEFLRQSWRALKPGGHLILSDILVTGPSVEIPDENVVSLAEYERLFEDAGFATPRIVSCRDRTWVPFRRRYFWNLVRILEWGDAVHWWRRSRQMDREIVDYLLVAAQKPPGGRFRPGPADRSDGSSGPGDSPGAARTLARRPAPRILHPRGVTEPAPMLAGVAGAKSLWAWWPGTQLNRRHADFQSLPGKMSPMTKSHDSSQPAFHPQLRVNACFSM